MTRILFISHNASRTGAPILLLHLLRTLLQTNRYSAEVVIVEDGPLRDGFAQLAPTTVLIKKKSTAGRIGAAWRKLWLRTRMARFEIVLSNTAANGDQHKLLHHHPRVMTYVHELSAVLRDVTDATARDALRMHTRLFLSPSASVTRMLRQELEIPLQKIHRLPYTLPDLFSQRDERRHHFRSGLNLPSDAIVVCMAGTRNRRKGFDLFLETAVHLSEIDPAIHLFWYGYPEHEVKILEETPPKNLHLFPETTDPVSVMAGADIFFLSSREDAYPLVMLEAAMMELPVVYFSGSGGADDFVDVCCGLPVPSFDCREAAEAIARLAVNADETKTKGRSGRERFLRLHNPETALMHFEDALRTIGIVLADKHPLIQKASEA